MASDKSKEIRKTLVKDTIDNVPIVQKRQEWDDYSKGITIPQGVIVTEESIKGIFCLWLRTQASLNDYVLVYMHGGGLTEGSVFTAREWTARLAQKQLFQCYLLTTVLHQNILILRHWKTC